ncbi:MAG: MFS transporter [Oscillospiraceae bacterium]|nr:MFS transporter [Oscillospiraceae bacterium]
MSTAKNKSFNGIACVILFLIGVIGAGNQVLVNHIQKAFAATDGEIGFLVSAVYLGSMSMVLALGEISERIGKRRGVAIAAGLVALGVFILLVSPSVAVAALAMLFVGFGTGGLESITMLLLEDNNTSGADRAIVLTEAFFSLGGVITPIIINRLVPDTVYKPVYLVFTVLFALAALALLLNRDIDRFAVHTKREGTLTIFKVAKDRLVLLCALGMVLYVGAEGAFCYWAVSYFEQNGAAWAGAYAISVYWLSSIVGRVVCTRIRNIANYLGIGFVSAAVFMALLVTVPGAWAKLAATALLGLALSPAYGCICFMGGHAFPQHSAAAYSLMVFGGAFGGVVTQPLIGSAAMVMPLRIVFLVVGGIYLVLFFLWRRIRRLASARQA